MDFSLKFIVRKDKPNNSGYAPIYIRYTHQRLSTNLPLKEIVLPQHWDEKSGRPFPNCPNKNKLQENMNQLERKVRDFLNNFNEKASRYPSAAELKKLFQYNKSIVTQTQLTFEQAFMAYKKSKESFVSSATMGVYETSFFHLKEFFTWSKAPMEWESIDINFDQKFKQYCFSKSFSKNTTGKYVKQIKAFLKFCDTNLKTIRSEQYECLKIESEVPEIVSFSRAEFETIKRSVTWSLYERIQERPKIPLTTREQKIARILIFLCCTGLRFSDFERLTFDNLFCEAEVDGTQKIYLKIAVRKTKKTIPVAIPLLDDALDILFLESNIPPMYLNFVWWYPELSFKIKSFYELVRDFRNGAFAKQLHNSAIHLFPHYPKVFSTITNQEFNREIKPLCKKLGIDAPVLISKTVGGRVKSRTVPKHQIVTSHIGRKTFVSLSLEAGIRTEFIQRVTGHTDYKSMKPYINITPTAVFNGFAERLNELGDKKKAVVENEEKLETPAKSEADKVIDKALRNRRSPFKP